MRAIWRKKIWSSVTICCVSFLLLFTFIYQSPRVATHTDEISWFFHTVFFDELFVKHNLDRSLWTSFEAFDHPVLSKYIFGSYLYMRQPSYGIERQLLLEKYGRWKFYTKIQPEEIPRTQFFPYVLEMREVNLAITIAVFIGLFVLYYVMSRQVLYSSLFTIVLGTNILFVSTLLRATTDSHYIFFLIWALVTYMVYLKTKEKKYLYGFAILASLSMSAKLIGAIVLVSYVSYGITQLYIKKSLLVLKEIFLVLVIFIITWIILNPTLYFSPVKNSITYFAFRNEQFTEQQTRETDEALLTVDKKIKWTYCTLFPPCERSYFFGLFAVPTILANSALFILGFIYLLKQTGKKVQKSVKFFFLLFFLVSGVVLISVVPLNWYRYILPLVITTTLLKCLGLQWAVDWVWGAIRRKKNM